MSTTYIFGHKKPDTDSVVSAIALSYLKNKLGEDTEPRVLGAINKETKFVLEHFGFSEPKFLNDVKVQVRNMNISKDVMINEKVCIKDAYDKINNLGVTGAPLINENGVLSGYTNLKSISKFLIEGNIEELNTSYDNIKKLLKGKEILKFKNDIAGNLLVASYRSETFIERINLTEDRILVVDDNYRINKYAIESGVQLIISCGVLPNDLVALAKKNNVSIIETNYSTFKVVNIIKLCNYINRVEVNRDPIRFSLSDYRDEVVEIANKFGHTNYPIVNKKNECIGMIKIVDINDYDKKKVILVDHNQKDQTVDGIEEAQIVEIVDHHNLGVIGTSVPINFRVMPVGCTSTIIYKLFNENNVGIPKDIAGIMASAIISDTLLFKSPTTTDLDIEVCNRLCTIAKIDAQEFGLKMFRAGSSIKGMSVDEIFNQDFKTYKASDDSHLGISQVMTLDFEDIDKDKKEYIHIMDDLHDLSGFKVAMMFVTDAIKNGSYIYYNEASKSMIEEAYNIKDLHQGMFIDELVSRKKQMLPPILESIDRKN